MSIHITFMILRQTNFRIRYIYTFFTNLAESLAIAICDLKLLLCWPSDDIPNCKKVIKMSLEETSQLLCMLFCCHVIFGGKKVSMDGHRTMDTLHKNTNTQNYNP